MAIIPHSHLSHVLSLLVGGVVPSLLVGRVVVFEESGSQRSDSQAGNEDDDDDGGGGDSHSCRRGWRAEQS